MKAENANGEISRLRKRNFSRLLSTLLGNTIEAGCSSEDSPEYTTNTRFVVEPNTGSWRASELRALVLWYAQNQVSIDEADWFTLFSIQEGISKKKDPIFVRLNIAIQFLIDRNFNKENPIKEAVKGILQYTDRSFFGNDLRLVSKVLRQRQLRVRALQTKKAYRSSLKRPKERAEPAHDWLPKWHEQYLPEETHFREEDTPIHELLSPTEVLAHLRVGVK